MNAAKTVEVLDDLSPGDITLIVLPGESFGELRKELVRYATAERDALVIYVTTNRPCTTLRTEFREFGVPDDSTFYIDCATALSAAGPPNVEDAIFLHPTELTLLSITIMNAVKSLPADREKVLVFDSLAMLQVHNGTEVLTRFAHSLFSNLKDTEAESVFLAPAEADEVFTSHLAQFVDEQVDI